MKEQGEAARAGIYGKGFAVVSPPIQDLADAAAELEGAKGSTEALVAIEGDIAEVLARNTAIRDAAHEIATAVTQAKKGLELIAGAAEQASTVGQQAATAARQQQQAATDLAATIDQIASMADEPQGAVRPRRAG